MLNPSFLSGRSSGVICAAIFLAYPATAAEPIAVVALGDSITRGVRTGVKADETFSSILAARLKVEVANVGVGGERTDGALQRLAKSVLAQKPKVVLIMYGTNDSYVDKGKAASRISVEAYRKNLIALLDRIRLKGGKPILMTEPRWAKGEKNGLGEDPNIRLEKYLEACREVAKKKKVPLVDHYQHWKEAEAKGQVIRKWTTDGCHPNPRGHKELADLIEPVLKKALEK